MAWQDALGSFASFGPFDPRPRGEIEDEVRAELEAHLAMRVEDNVVAGMDPEAARRDAEQRFGDIEAIARACQDQWTGGWNMLHRIHFVVSIALGLAVVWMIAQNRRLDALRAQSRAVAEEHAAHALEAQRELLEKYEPEGELVFRVGDRVEIRDTSGKMGDIEPEVVQRDGKLLLPDIGWVEVAGRTRTDVEAAIREAYQPYYAESVDVRLVVVEDERD